MAPPPAGGIDHSAASTLYWRSWRDSPRDVALWRSSSRRAPSQVLFARGQHGALDEVPYYDDSLPMYRVRTRAEDKRRRSRLSVRVRADDRSPPDVPAPSVRYSAKRISMAQRIARRHAAHSSRSVTAMRARAARTAGGTPPTSPISSANPTPHVMSMGVMRNAKARCENVCQLSVPVVYPLSGSTTMQPRIPPTSAMHSASMTNDITTLPAPKPSARMVAISRARAVTAEYIVLSAPKTAPMPITAATIEPRTVMSVVSCRDCFA